MSLSVYAMPGNEDFADLLALHGHWGRNALALHRFPDGETLVTVAAPEPGGDALITCSLDHPDPKILPLLAACTTLRELGAAHVGLACAYLGYMRQDARFHPGEAVSSCVLGRLLDAHFDWVATIDPHLHRHASLAEAGLTRGMAISAAPAIAAWIEANVSRPLIVGPDAESAQWVGHIAMLCNAPSVVAGKMRRGDRQVEVTLPALEAAHHHRTPVLVDDIVSSGQTVAQCGQQVQRQGLPAPVCVVVHGIFAEGAVPRILAAGVTRIVATNTINQPYAVIDVSPYMASAISQLELSAGRPDYLPTREA